MAQALYRPSLSSCTGKHLMSGGHSPTWRVGVLPGHLAGESPAALGARVWKLAGLPRGTAVQACPRRLRPPPSGPAPLSACQGIKGLWPLCRALPPLAVSSHQTAALTDSFPLAVYCPGTGYLWPGVGHGTLAPASGARVVAECVCGACLHDGVPREPAS